MFAMLSEGLMLDMLIVLHWLIRAMMITPRVCEWRSQTGLAGCHRQQVPKVHCFCFCRPSFPPSLPRSHSGAVYMAGL